jgi:glutaminase
MSTGMIKGVIVAALLCLAASAVQAQAPAGIPALAKVDSKIYGIALVTVDGKVHTVGM